MPRILFAKKNHETIAVAEGANLMQSLLAENVPVASSCHGDGVCAKCRLMVMAKPEQVSPQTELEDALLSSHGLGQPWRISCQVKVLSGDVTVDASYW